MESWTPNGQAPGQLQDSRAQQPSLYRWGELEPPQRPLLESPIPSANWCPPLFVHGEGSESPPIPSSVSQAFLPQHELVKSVTHYGDPVTHGHLLIHTSS